MPLTESTYSVSNEDIELFWANRRAEHVIAWYFRDENSMPNSDSNPPLLSKSAAYEHSRALRSILENDPNEHAIVVPKEVSRKTLGRFIQCISPELRAFPPTHDLETKTKLSDKVITAPIQWTHKALSELYHLSRNLGADDVCDMLTDYCWAQLKAGDFVTDATLFNKLAEDNDWPALNFWLDVMIACDTLDLKKQFKKRIWNESMKTALHSRLSEQGSRSALWCDEQSRFCEEYHHHAPEEGELCYIEKVSRQKEDFYDRAAMAKLADKLRLSDFIRNMQTKLMIARWTADKQGEVDAKEKLQKAEEILRKAAKIEQRKAALRQGGTSISRISTAVCSENAPSSSLGTNTPVMEVR